MPTYTITGPDGKDYSIDGPPGATREEVIAAIQQRLAAKSEQMGFGSSFAEGLKSLLPLPKALRHGKEDTAETRQALLQATEPEGARMSFEQAQTPGDYWDWAKQQLGTSLGYFATPAAAGIAARTIAGATPVGRAVGLATTAATLGGQYLASNVGRQAAAQQAAIERGEQPKPTELGRAAIASAGQAGLDLFALKPLQPLLSRTPFVRALLGAEGKAGEELAAQAAQSYLSAAMGGAAKASIYEVPTEIGQQILERWQAGLPINDADAKREYLEAFAGAALMGGVFGGVSGAIETRAARSKQEQEELLAAQKNAKTMVDVGKKPPGETADKPVPPTEIKLPDAWKFSEPPPPPPTPSSSTTPPPPPPPAGGAAIPGATPPAPQVKAPIPPPTVREPAPKPAPPITEEKLDHELLYASAKQLVTANLTAGVGKTGAQYLASTLKVPLRVGKEIRDRLIADKVFDPRTNKLVQEAPPAAPAPAPQLVEEKNAADENYNLAMQYVLQTGTSSAAAIRAQLGITPPEAKAIRDRLIADKVINKSGKLLVEKNTNVLPSAPATVGTDTGTTGAGNGVPVQADSANNQVTEKAQPSGVGVDSGLSGRTDAGTQGSEPALEEPLPPLERPAPPTERTVMISMPLQWTVFHDTDGTFSYQTAKGEKAIGFPTETEAADAAAARYSGKETPAVVAEKTQQARAIREQEKQAKAEAKQQAEAEAEAEKAGIETDAQIQAEPEEAVPAPLPATEAVAQEEAEPAKVERRRKKAEQKQAEKKTELVRLYRVEPTGEPTNYRSIRDWMGLGSTTKVHRGASKQVQEGQPDRYNRYDMGAVFNPTKDDLVALGTWFTDDYNEARRVLEESYPDGTITAVNVTPDEAAAVRISSQKGRARWKGVKLSHRAAVKAMLARKGAADFSGDIEQEVYVPPSVAARRAAKAPVEPVNSPATEKKLLRGAFKYLNARGALSVDEAAKVIDLLASKDADPKIAAKLDMAKRILNTAQERINATEDVGVATEEDTTTSLEEFASRKEFVEQFDPDSWETDEFESSQRMFEDRRRADWGNKFSSKGWMGRYSRGPNTTGASTVEGVTQQVLQDFGKYGDWLIKNRVIQVVQSVTDLPGSGHPGDVKGFFDGKRVYLVADNIGLDNLRALTLHEVGVHMGLKKLLGDKNYTSLSAYVQKKARENPDSIYGHAMRVAVSALPEGHTMEQFNDEMLGYLVEMAPDNTTKPFFSALFRWLRLAVYTLFGGNFGSLDETDIALLAMSALKREAILSQPQIKSIYDSNGKQIHATARGISNFWKWFGNSQMVDAQGRPLVLYHGTDAVDYEEFWVQRPHQRGIATWIGVHTAPDPTISDKFAYEPGIKYGRVIPLYIKAENILDLTQYLDPATGYYQRGGRKWIGDDTFVAQEVVRRGMTPEFLAAHMRLKGFLPETRNGWEQDIQVKKAAAIMAAWARGEKATFRWSGFDTTAVGGYNGPGSMPFDAILSGVNGIKEYTKEEYINANVDNVFDYGIRPEFRNEATKMLRKFLRDSGYDAIKYINTSELETADATDKTSYIVFNPTQLKSAVGNVGAFNPTDPNMRYSRSFKDMSQGLLDRIQNGVNNLPPGPREPTGSFSERFIGALSNLPDELRAAAFGMMSMPQIAEVMEKYLPTLNKLVVTLEERASALSERKAYIDRNLSEFHALRNKYAPLMPEFFYVANQSTVWQIDVLDPATANDPLTLRFKALPVELQNAYAKLRAEYKAYGDHLINVVTKMATGTAANEIRAKFESKRLKVYLPLFRMGNYWLSYTDSEGDTVTQAFDSQHERKLAKIYAAGQGAKDFKDFTRLSQISYKTVPSMGFMGDVLTIMREAKADDSMINDVYTAFLDYLPGESLRNQFKKRGGEDGDRGVKGFMPDVFQVYANMGVRMANQMSNMEYAADIEEHLANLRAEHAENPTEVVQAAIDNVEKQLDFIRNPVAEKWASKASYFSYMWFIAGNISSAVVNMTQVPIIVYPLLGGEYGYDKSAEAIAKAWSKYFKGGLDDNSEFLPDWTFGKGSGLSAEHKRLYEAAVKRTAIRRSTGYEITEAQRLDYRNYNGMRAKVDHMLGYVFQNSERANREVTLLAAFDLARERGLSVDESIEKALKLVNDAHGVALAEIGPRYFQKGLGKIIFTFKRFAQAQLYLIARLFKTATKGESQLTRDMARRQLLGIYATTFAFAGVQGMPLYGAAALLAKLLMDDDDDPFDPDAEVRAALGDLGYKGPVNQMLSVDIASRTGFNGLLWRDDPKRLADLGYVHYIAEALAGPAGGALINAERGVKLLEKGEYWRGTEAMLPAALRSGLKSIRFGTEGALTTKGVPIIEDVNGYNTFMQVFGFNPSDLAEARATASAIEKRKDKMLNRRTALLDKLDAARMAGDTKGVWDVMRSIDKFNSKNPDYRITRDTISRSYKQRRSRERDTLFGVYVPQQHRKDLLESAGVRVY